MTTQHPDTPETGITPGGTSGAFRDVLSKDHARRGKPPLHFVDMTPEQRVEKAAELGLPKFRVKQLANHYFGHFDVNAAEFTDFPAAKRSEAAAAFFPQLITEVTRQVAAVLPVFLAGLLPAAFSRMTTSYFYAIARNSGAYLLIYGEPLLLFALLVPPGAAGGIWGTWAAMPLSQAMAALLGAGLLWAAHRRRVRAGR